MHAVELVADVAPGVAGAVFDDPYEEQSEPAELDVASDPVLPMMEDGTESERSLHVPPAPLHFEQLLVGEGEIGGGETVVAGAQQPLAVQLRLSGNGRLVNSEPAVLETTDQSPEGRRGAQPSGQFVTLRLAPLVGAFDLGLQIGDQVGPDLLVPLFCLGVETDHEALFPRTFADPDLLHLEVAGSLVETTGTGERFFRFPAGVPQSFCHHVVAAAALEIGPIGH